MCTSLALFLCRPPQVWITRSPELDSLGLDHHESTLRQVSLPCGFKKRLWSCQHLQVCSLFVDSTVGHLCTPCVRWRGEGGAASVDTSMGFPRGFLLSSIHLDESSPTAKFSQPYWHCRKTLIPRSETPLLGELWRLYPQIGRTCGSSRHRRNRPLLPNRQNPSETTYFDLFSTDSCIVNILQVFTIDFAGIQFVVNHNSQSDGQNKSAKSWTNLQKKTIHIVSLQRNREDAKDNGISPRTSQAKMSL